MNTSIATIVGALIIAGTMVFIFRYEVSPAASVSPIGLTAGPGYSSAAPMMVAWIVPNEQLSQTPPQPIA
jgi:hypothetical protein